ncbi:MAG: chemotaxis protein CheW [Alsobacter sp.]
MSLAYDSMSNRETSASSEAMQRIVTFKVDGRSFGVDVASVREIKGWQPTTPLPNAALHVLGVINLRGAIIAVYDLRRRLGLGASTISRSSVVIVVDLGERLAGLLVDAVSDIVDIQVSALRPAPEIAGEGDDILQALVVKGDDVVALLDLASVIRESMGLAA